MTTPDERQRALEEFNIAELAAESMLNHKALMWLSHDTIQTIRQCLQQPDAAEKMAEALGMFLNGMAYYETFPDNEEDAKQLRKSATYNFLRARNHLPDAIADKCSMACKRVYTEEYEASKKEGA